MKQVRRELTDKNKNGKWNVINERFTKAVKENEVRVEEKTGERREKTVELLTKATKERYT